MPRLRWTQTHDAIELTVVDHSVYEYFVEQLNINALNQYTVSDLRYASLSQELQQRFDRVQSFVQNRLYMTDFDREFDPSNQDDLNHLHMQWVKLHQRHPNIATVAEHVLPGDLPAINRLIHAIEESTTELQATTPDPNHMMHNRWGTKILGFGLYNISVAYNNLGRSTWQKWQHADTDIGSDLNNFSEIYTTLKINVSRTEARSAPVEYQAWCDQNNLPCVGNQMPLANFDKLDENLLYYRQLFYKNSLIENNFITLE
jgi:uncharacterized protein YacL (UPF0231 family)